MLVQVTHLKQCKQKLQEDIKEKRALHDDLQGELAEAQTDRRQAQADYGRLQAEVKSMRHSLEVAASLLHTLSLSQI